MAMLVDILYIMYKDPGSCPNTVPKGSFLTYVPRVSSSFAVILLFYRHIFGSIFAGYMISHGS